MKFSFFKTRGKSPFARWTPTLCGALLACLLLLSACDLSANVTHSQAATDNQPTASPSPTITPALQRQGASELQAFQEWINLMKQYGGNVESYQQQYSSDQQALNSATSDSAYQQAFKKLQGHVNAIKLPALRTEAQSLLQELQQGASAWSQKHTYYDSYNQTTYHLGYEYGPDGISGWAQDEIASSQTLADYQQTIENLQMWLTNFKAYKADFVDKTPYSQVHATDMQLLKHYGYMSGKVIVISLAGEAMRVYENGKLVKAFLVVTGMPSHPSLPGTWWIESKLYNTKFTSGKKPGQEGYYPDTPIKYAMQYHSGGYFIHQSWWRSEYGPNKQFPHFDPGGTAFAYEGSHGCVNMSTEDIEWLYNNFATISSTKVLIY